MGELSSDGVISSQIKSKARVAAHGEVFTNEREVNAMLDLVKQETERHKDAHGQRAAHESNQQSLHTLFLP